MRHPCGRHWPKETTSAKKHARQWGTPCKKSIAVFRICSPRHENLRQAFGKRLLTVRRLSNLYASWFYE